MKYNKLRDLADSWLRELSFSLIQISLLKNALEEINTINKCPLIEKVIDNYLERHELDKIIHAKKIFNK